MKYLLILYPIQPYADALIGKEELPETKVRVASLYQQLIQKRYPGFQLVCVMFSRVDEQLKPDISQLWNGFILKEGDIVGACGITFIDHCESKVYSKENDIIALCSKPIDELVVGGFHLWDCVDKVARYAHKLGINVLVDEDLTELFFYSIRSRNEFPVLKIPISKKESLRKTRKQLSKAGPHFLEETRQARVQRPWFDQI